MYPHERSLVTQYQQRPFALIGVNSDADRDAIRRIVREKDLTWRSFWAGPDGPLGAIPRRWDIQAWPTLFLIDAQGVLRWSGHDSAGIEERIDALLAEIEVGRPEDREMVEENGDPAVDGPRGAGGGRR